MAERNIEYGVTLSARRVGQDAFASERADLKALREEVARTKQDLEKLQKQGAAGLPGKGPSALEAVNGGLGSLLGPQGEGILQLAETSYRSLTEGLKRRNAGVVEMLSAPFKLLPSVARSRAGDVARSFFDGLAEAYAGTQDMMGGGIIKSLPLVGPIFQNMQEALLAPLRGVGKLFGWVGDVGTAAFRGLIGAAKMVGSIVVSAISGAIRIVQSLSSAVLNAAKAFGIMAAAATAAVVVVAKSGIDAAMQKQTFLAKLSTATKSDEMGRRWFEWAKTFADKTPFDTPEVVDITSRMLLRRMDPKQLIPILGATAGAVGKSLGDTYEMYADAIMGEFERAKEFGIKGRDLLQYGAIKAASGQGVDTASEKGQAAATTALLRLMQDRYGGGMEKLAATSGAALSNLRGAIWSLKVALGEALLPVLNKAVDWLTKMVGALQKMGVAEQVGGWLSKLGDLIFNNVAPAIEHLIGLWPRLAQSVSDFFGTGAASTEKTAAGFGGLVGASKGASDALQAIWAGRDSGAGQAASAGNGGAAARGERAGAEGVVSPLQQWLSRAGDWFGTLWERITVGAGIVWRVVSELGIIIPLALQAGIKAFADVRNWLVIHIPQAVMWTLDAVDKLGQWFIKLGMQIEGFARTAAVAIGGVLQMVGSLLDAMTTGLQVVADGLLFLAKQGEKLHLPGAKEVRSSLDDFAGGLRGGEKSADVGRKMVAWGEETGWQDKYTKASWGFGLDMQMAKTAAANEFAGPAWQPTNEPGIPVDMMQRADRIAGAVLDVVEKRLRDYVNGNAAWQRTGTVRAGAL